MKFYNHHNHTHFSVLDAVTGIDELVELTKTRGLESVTITDHGRLAGTYKLWKKCKELGVKPVLGCECYWLESYDGEGGDIPYNYGHVIVLAQNATGWRNLKKLQEIAWEKGFLVKPRIQLADLIKYNEGLIITTGCMNGLLGMFYSDNNVIYKNFPLKKRKKKAERWIKKLKLAFGDRIYAEIQLLDLEEQVKLNRYVIEVAEKYDIPIIPALDSHYIHARDSLLHDVVICMLWHSQLADEDNHTYPTKQLWCKTYSELEASRKKWYKWISKTQLKAYCVNAEKLQASVEDFPIIPEGSPLPVISEHPDEDLKQICKQHSEFDKFQKKKAYRERFQTEYDVITSLGFSNYFLVVRDIADYCRREGIPYNARGSVNGSLISYLMNISWVDPIKFDCPFERFLTADRLSLPDIDMDIGKEKRTQVISYVRDKYGKDCVAHISNYTKLKPKSSIKDVAKVLGFQFQEVNDVTRTIKDADMAIAPNSDYEDYFERWEALKEYPDVVKYLEENEELSELAERMLSVNRQMGIHASGVVVTPTAISDWCPVTYSLDGKRGVNKGKVEKLTEWDMYDLEDAGILKLDFLSQNTLDIIAYTIKMVGRRVKVPYKNFDGLCEFILAHLDDKKTYEMISSGKNIGMFQLGTSDGMVELSKEVVPSSLEDITAIISLHRTAILKEGMHKEFVKRRFGKGFTYIHPEMEKILGDTHGILLFQEQTSGLAVHMAGFTPTEADHFRKGIKLKDKRKIDPWKKKFVSGCKEKHGLSKEESLEIWKFIEAFSFYGFNKSHGVSYALVAYITAYLKANYPYEFMTAVLSYNTDDDDKLKVYLNEAKRMGLKIYSPEINKSSRNFKLSKSGLLYPFNAVKQVGPKAIQAILKARKKGRFTSLEDFRKRTDGRVVNVSVICNLILAGSFRKFGKKEALYEYFLANIVNDDKIRQMYCADCGKRYPCLIEKKAYTENGIVCPVCGGVSVSVSVKTCKGKAFDKDYVNGEIYGYVLGHNKLKAFVDILAKEEVEPIGLVADMNEGDSVKLAFEITAIKTHIDKNQNEMAFIDITDGMDDSSVVVFASDWESLKSQLTKGGCYLAELLVNRGKLLFSSRGYKQSKIAKLTKNKV